MVDSNLLHLLLFAFTKMIPPFSFASWVAENEDKLHPPVNNYCLYSGEDFTLMVVGGPNARNDYHGIISH